MANPDHEFDAFIFYSHAADGSLAPALQTGLEKIARPWYRLRSVRLFRDQTNLSANPSLWNSIESALARSRWFILLASPEAAKSRWVAKEIDWWLTNRSAETLLIVITEGGVRWDDADNGFAPRTSTAIPAALHNAFQSEPLYVDLRWAREPGDLSQSSVRLRSALFDIAASIRGMSKDELDGEAVRTLRRNRAWAGTAVLLLAVSGAWALISRDAAVKSATRTSVELDARTVLAIAGTKNQANALPLAIMAAAKSIDRLEHSPVSILTALRYGIESSREVRRWKADGQIRNVAFDADGKHLIAVLRSNEVQRWTIDGASRGFRFGSAQPLVFDDDQFSFTLTSSRAAILTRMANKRFRLWGLDGTDRLSGRSVDTHLVDVASLTHTVYAVDHAGRLKVYRSGRTGPVLLKYRVRQALAELHVSPDEALVVFIYRDGRVDVLRSGGALSSLAAACREASGLARNGRMLVSVGCGHARITDLDTMSESVRDHTALALVKEIAVDASGAFAVVHERDDRVDWFNNRGALAAESILGVESPAIAVAPDGSWLAAGGYLDGALRLFDLKDRSARPLTDRNRRLAVSSLDVCTDRPELYWATQDGEMGLVRYLEPAAPSSWPASKDYIEIVRCVPGKGAITSDRGGTIAYWKAPANPEYLRRDPKRGFDAISVGRLSRTVWMPTPQSLERWQIGGEIRRLPSLPIAFFNSSWFRVIVGNKDRNVAVSSDTGQIAIYDASSGRPKMAPRKLLWSNGWTLSGDLSDEGFAVAGAGTEVAILDWSGTVRASFRTDQFLFATDTAYDSARNVFALPTMSGEVIIRDLQGTAVGPPIRNVGDNQFVYVRFSPERYLFTGGLDFGLMMHDFDVTRLFRLACRMLNARDIPDDDYSALSTRASAACANTAKH